MSELTKKHSEIKESIKKHSPFDEKETNRILNKFFNSIPANVELLIKKYQFDKKKVLDIGCSYGQSLLYWGEDSEGIEILDHMLQLLKSLNRVVHKINVEDGFQDLKKENYDAIYSNNLIEHLLSPHLFLVRLHSLLRPLGILAIGCPVAPPCPFQNIYKLLGYQGWLAVEHINFFTPKTIKLTLERAGFEVKYQYFPRVSQIHPFLNKLFKPFAPHILSICQKKEGFKYHSKQSSEFNPSWALDLKHFR